MMLYQEVPAMNQLEENRAVIGDVDQEMAQLFVRRFEAVRKIAQYKMERGLPVLDRSREEALIAEKEQLVPEELRPYFRMWYEGMMGASRAYQSDLIARHTDGSGTEE
jgi:chorismate mutase